MKKIKSIFWGLSAIAVILTGGIFMVIAFRVLSSLYEMISQKIFVIPLVVKIILSASFITSFVVSLWTAFGLLYLGDKCSKKARVIFYSKQLIV